MVAFGIRPGNRDGDKIRNDVRFTAKVNVVISAFAICFEALERAIRFEPMVNGFAGRRLWPLGYARSEVVHAERFELPISCF